MFLILKWQIISWIIGCGLVILLLLNIFGVVPWLEWWVYAIFIVLINPALIVMAIVGIVAYFGWKFARSNGGRNGWSDK